MFAAKMTTWAKVRNIANVLTNQLYLADDEARSLNIEQAHLSRCQQGPRRWFETEAGHTGVWRSAGNIGGWWAFDEQDVKVLGWESLTSGCKLEARKVRAGWWTIRFIASETDPAYRGSYFHLYAECEGVNNIDPEYAYESRKRA